MRKLLLAAAAVAAAIAMAGFVWAFRTPWAEQTSFDIIGVLWLMQNLPKIFVLVMSTLLLGVCAYLVAKAYTLVGHADGRSLDDESRRILEDPRFHGIVRPPGSEDPRP